MKRRHVLATPADTHALGNELAVLFRPGDLVVLVGPLGAGKTAMAQGRKVADVAQALITAADLLR